MNTSAWSGTRVVFVGIAADRRQLSPADGAVLHAGERRHVLPGFLRKHHCHVALQQFPNLHGRPVSMVIDDWNRAPAAGGEDQLRRRHWSASSSSRSPETGFTTKVAPRRAASSRRTGSSNPEKTMIPMPALRSRAMTAS